jgi:hypothetical protein
MSVAIAALDLIRQLFRLRQKSFLQTHSPVHPNAYFENVAGQVRPLVRERLPAQL